MARNFWGYRIDTRQIPYFRTELHKGILRQGWGSSPSHDLRSSEITGGARRNRSIFKKIKKGGILLVPRLPSRNEVAIAEATEDFQNGYSFEITPGMKDYGHRFPARLIKQFSRENPNVPGKVRASLKNPGRFWTMNDCSDDIEAIMAFEDEELLSKQSFQDRFSAAVNDTFTNAFKVPFKT